ncbi:gephyrin-like molybdotransferase Glp [Patulibacter sp. SYSU D01012]|uniref:molybdopterin molybdotransferase MoeA n=1 Tax=Patulibacter sp. SYSU D01012 TaxID=2817381 RepID=UPI001B3115EF|nr:gephyrin-like molybdotransferase Glp [Patulibacter sp. SYSU D01012]
MSTAPLTPLGDAIAVARRLGAALALGHEHVPIAEALGRTTSADVRAVRALPGFASSGMDGFAVRAADLAGATDDAPVALRITAESRAGAPAAAAVGPGDAIRIATGAVVPDGADAVVPYEEVTEAGGRATFTAPAAPGAFVRPAGTDVAAGAVLVPAGTRLAPHHLAPLSGAGHGQVPVRRRPRVSVLLTGDEVVRGAGPDAALPPGHVHDVNGVVLPALVRTWGGELAEVVPLPDDRDVTRDAIAWASGDLLVVCGGMSMGPHDHVRPALDELGARAELFRVALQPGKPTWLGTLPGEDGARPVLGLPGNPASVFVTATLLLRAALDAALGRPPAAPLRGRLTAPTTGLPGRTAARRACVSVYGEGTLAVTILDGQASHLLGSLGAANALAIVPPDEQLQAGAVVDLVPLEPADAWAHAGGSVHDHPRL